MYNLNVTIFMYVPIQVRKIQTLKISLKSYDLYLKKKCTYAFWKN